MDSWRGLLLGPATLLNWSWSWLLLLPCTECPLGLRGSSSWPCLITLLGMMYSQVRRNPDGVYNVSELRLASMGRLIGLCVTTEPGLRISAIINWTNAHIFELVLGWCDVAGAWWGVIKFELVLGWGGVVAGGGCLNVKSSLIYVVTHRRTSSCTHVFEPILGCCGVAWCWWSFWRSICGGLMWKIISIRSRSSISEHMLTRS